jgi:hypothetical protein
MSGFLGSGNVYFNRLVAGAFEGMIDLGNCTQFAITENGEMKTRPSRLRAQAGTALSTVTRKTPTTFAITWDEQGTPDNVELSTHGTLAALSQSADTATEVTRTLVLDKWVEIDPGVRNVSNVLIATKTEGTDFVVNERLGLIKALNSGTAGSKTVTYDQGTRAGSVIAGSTMPVIRGHFILDGINEDGEEPCIVDVWDAVLMSASALDPLSDEFATGQMSGNLNKPSASHPLGAKDGPYQVQMQIVDG